MPGKEQVENMSIFATFRPRSIQRAESGVPPESFETGS